jgi:hypothetical protein
MKRLDVDPVLGTKPRGDSSKKSPLVPGIGIRTTETMPGLPTPMGMDPDVGSDAA